MFSPRETPDERYSYRIPSPRSAKRAHRRTKRRGRRFRSDDFLADREVVLEHGARTLGFEERLPPPLVPPPPPLSRASPVQLDYIPIPGYTAPPTPREYFRFRRPRNAWSEGSCFRDRHFEPTRKKKIDDLKSRNVTDDEIAKTLLIFDTSVNNRNLANQMWRREGFTSQGTPTIISRPRTACGTKKKKRKAKAKKVRFSRTRRPRRSKRRSRRIRRRKPTPYRSTSRNRKSNNSASSITFSPTDVPTY